MKTEHTIHGVRAALRSAKKNSQSVAFVPTMGNLHCGHIELILEAKRRADFVVCSIFVNPTQFGANEDFATYPRTLERDGSLLADAGCDLVFIPDATEMYHDGRQQLTQVHVDGITEHLCGASRPGHFSGVATVVTKLLNIITPDMAFFGEKDYQQLAVIRQMVQDLCLSTNIIGVPTIRDTDGLALSSRNQYLTDSQRAVAPHVYKALCRVRDGIQKDASQAEELCRAAHQSLEASGFVVDYLCLQSRELAAFDAQQSQAVVLVAAYLGKTRLIDNLVFDIRTTASTR